MSTQLIIAPNAMPALQLPADVLAKVQAQLKQAAGNQSSSLPRLSFGGKQFNVTLGGNTVPLDDRVLDVHIVAIDPQFHYAFYAKTKVVSWFVTHCQLMTSLSHLPLNLHSVLTNNVVL